MLAAWHDGEPGAQQRLLELLYHELKCIARRQMRGERHGHTLQPTAVVHEAYLRLIRQRSRFVNRAQFLAVAAQAMRRVLVDHHRRRAAKRRAGADRPDPHGGLDPGIQLADSVDVLALDQALERFARLDARAAKIVELRFFGGLEVEEVAAALGVSPSSVERDWRLARMWLRRELAGRPETPPAPDGATR